MYEDSLALFTSLASVQMSFHGMGRKGSITPSLKRRRSMFDVCCSVPSMLRAPCSCASDPVHHLLYKGVMLVHQILRGFLYGFWRVIRGGTWRSLTRIRVRCTAISQP